MLLNCLLFVVSSNHSYCFVVIAVATAAAAVAAMVLKQKHKHASQQHSIYEGKIKSCSLVEILIVRISIFLDENIVFVMDFVSMCMCVCVCVCYF